MRSPPFVLSVAQRSRKMNNLHELFLCRSHHAFSSVRLERRAAESKDERPRSVSRVALDLTYAAPARLGAAGIRGQHYVIVRRQTSGPAFVGGKAKTDESQPRAAQPAARSNQFSISFVRFVVNGLRFWTAVIRRRTPLARTLKRHVPSQITIHESRFTQCGCCSS